jgi:3D (Asp-Asp-Asp) domain-containing protein
LNNSPDFIITAYDLSVASCGKLVSDRGYGITANGKSLKGLDLRTASTISTDTSIIPLGSIVYLYFNNETAKKYNGLYISNDTGSAIKGNRIDLFFGDEKSSRNALNFGRQLAKVILIE